MEFELLYRKQFNRAALAEYLEVTEKTIIRWEKTNKPPKAVILLLQLLNNDLSHLGKEWEGFYFHNQRLYSPEKEPVQAGHIRAIKYNRITIEFLKRERSKAVNHVGNEKLKSCALNK